MFIGRLLKAFDVVRHALVLGKLSTLGLPSPILNWIVHFLTGRTQATKAADGTFSISLFITQVLIQHYGSGLLWKLICILFLKSTC